MDYDTWKTTQTLDPFEPLACEACDSVQATHGRYCVPCTQDLEAASVAYEAERLAARAERFGAFDVARSMRELGEQIAKMSRDREHAFACASRWTTGAACDCDMSQEVE